VILTDIAFCTQIVLNRHANSPESLDLQGAPGLSFLLTLGAGMFCRNFLFRLFREKGGFFRLFCMAVLLCSKKCKPAWRNDLAINIKLTAATYGGFHTYFKYQTENYDTVISALAESSMSILGTADGVGEERRRHVTCN
jgi:hypothetical protein